MSDAAATLGDRLKAERERRGVSTQKAADDLHLESWVIEALEAGDYARIGPSVYAKGYLKKYASTLGVSAGDVSLGAEPKVGTPAMPMTPTPVSAVHGAARGAGSLSRNAAVALLLLIAAVASALWWRPWRAHAERVAAQAPATPAPDAGEPAAARAVPRAVPPTDATPTDAPPADVPAGHAPTGYAAAAAAAPASSAAHSTVAGESPASAPPPPKGTGRARLRFSFSADSWVEVHDSSGRRVFAGRGLANSVKTIAGMAPLKVYLGYASGVQMQLNDRAVAIGPQFLSGDVARFEAGADGVLRRESAAPPNEAHPGLGAPRG